MSLFISISLADPTQNLSHRPGSARPPSFHAGGVDSCTLRNMHNMDIVHNNWPIVIQLFAKLLKV